MEVRFTPSIDDHVAMLDFHERFSPWYRRAVRRHFVTITLGTVLIPLIIAAVCVQTYGWSWVTATIFVLFIAAVQWAMGRFSAEVFAGRLRERWRRSIERSPSTVDLSEHRIGVEPESIVCATDSLRSTYPANSLRRMIEMRGALFMDFGPYVLRIPDRAFASNGDRQQWYDTVSAAAMKPIDDLLVTESQDPRPKPR